MVCNATIKILCIIIIIIHLPCYITAGSLGFVLNGVSYFNGSTVLRTDIGEGAAALQCTTDRAGCCSGSGRAGEFYFPDDTRVPILGPDPSIRTYYKDRDNGFIRLNRINNSMETGQFRCEIPDASGTTVNLFINIGVFC